MFQSRKPTLFNRTVLGCAVFSASMGLASQVHAQKQLEEVVVTAQKRAQSANDVGITINAFTGQQIRDFGVFTAEDIAMRTPGLTVNETAATGVPLYTIRGVGFQDYSLAQESLSFNLKNKIFIELFPEITEVSWFLTFKYN